MVYLFSYLIIFRRSQHTDNTKYQSSGVGWRVLDGAERQVCPLALLLPQTVRLAVVRLGVRQLGDGNRDLVQRQLLLPPVVRDHVQQAPLHLHLAVHVCNVTTLYISTTHSTAALWSQLPASLGQAEHELETSELQEAAVPQQRAALAPLVLRVWILWGASLVIAGGRANSNFLFFLMGHFLPPVALRLCQWSREIPISTT